MNEFTVESLKAIVPKALKSKVNYGLVDLLNNVSKDTSFGSEYKDNVLTYLQVLEQGKWSLEQYLDAVRFLSLRLMGNTVVDSYKRAFPDRVLRLMDEGYPTSYIEKYANSFNRTKIMTKLYEQSMVPFYLINQDARQRALNTQLHIMQSSKNDMARVKAADSVLQHTAPPPNAELNVTVTQEPSSELAQLSGMLNQLATQQINAVNQGQSLEKVINPREVLSNGVE